LNLEGFRCGISMALSLLHKWVDEENFMNKVIIFLIMIPAMSWAKVSNFNDLIKENSQAQEQLQQNLEESTEQAKASLDKSSDKVLVMEGRTYNAPTSRTALRFQKEVNHYRPSQQKQLDRLADEISASNREF